MNITELVTKWQAVVKQRKELDALSKKIKEGPEAQLRAEILMYLDSQGMNGAKTDRGTVTRTAKTHLEIVDMEKFLSKQFYMLMNSVHDTKPFADNLIMQKSAHKGFITEVVRNELGLSPNDELTDEQFNSVSMEFGVKRVSDPDISFKSI